ncbi:MAG: TIR domain-containing protein [Gemmatimonadetes bacterium]|nr:TIR domain-containing protein [Gemmatimonadota bacterium]
MSAPSVFISYAREDDERARNLYKRLRNAGFTPWLDRFDLIGGEDFDRATRKALKEAVFVIICLSNISIAKRGYVQRELKIALDRGQEMLRDDIYIIPVRLEPCEVPDELAGLQWVDVFEAEGWGRLIQALNTGLARRGGAVLPVQDAESAEAARAAGPTPGTGPAADTPHEPADDLEDVPPSPPNGRLAGPAQRSPSTSAPGNGKDVASLVPTLPPEVTRSARWLALSQVLGRIPPRWFLLSGVVTLLLSNALLAVGHSDSILTFLYDSFGFQALRNLDLVMRSIALAVLACGYVLLGVWLVRAGPAVRSNSARVRQLGTLVMVGAVATANFVFGTPDRAALTRVLARNVVGFAQGWTDQLMGRQAPSGGIVIELPGQQRTQVWTTAQALSGILTATRLGFTQPDRSDVWRAFEYIEQSRSSRTGDGWAYWDDGTRTVTEIGGWVVVATANAIRTPGALPDSAYLATLRHRIARDLHELLDRQHESGGWTPIRDATGATDTRTYSTLMAVWALLDGRRLDGIESPTDERLDEALRAGARWLLSTRHPTRDWVPNPSRTDGQFESFPGLTAQVIVILSELAREEVGAFLIKDAGFIQAKKRMLAGIGSAEILLSAPDSRVPDSDVHLSISDFVLEGSTFLELPWTFAALRRLALDEQLTRSDRALASRQWVAVAVRAEEVNTRVLESPPYTAAESLYTLVYAAAERPGAESVR